MMNSIWIKKHILAQQRGGRTGRRGAISKPGPRKKKEREENRFGNINFFGITPSHSKRGREVKDRGEREERKDKAYDVREWAKASAPRYQGGRLLG